MATNPFPPSGWIWLNQPLSDNGEPVYALFRKELSIEEAPDQFVLHISADSRYRLYVNGVSVFFGPCKGDRQLWYYDEVDIAAHLHSGVNCLAAEVLHYSPLTRGNASVWRTHEPGLYVRGESLLGDDSWTCRLATHKQFISESRAYPFLHIMERAKGDAALAGWLLPGFDDSAWDHAMIRYSFFISKNTALSNLQKRPIPLLYETRRSFLDFPLPLTVKEHSTKILELNAGELTTGFLQLLLCGGQGADIELLTSECYAYPNPAPGYAPMPRKGNRLDKENGQLFGLTDVYTAAGYGTPDMPEAYQTFWFRTFRFVRLKITTKDAPLTVLSFDYRETGYPLDVKTKIQFGSDEMARNWEISVRTLRRCMHETYEDCPFYEQLQYAMDTRSQILFTYNISADDTLARKAIDDFHRSLSYEGLINSCYPCVTANIIPGFSLYYIMMIYDHMMYFGDAALVERYAPTVDAILAFFHRHLDGQGLVGKIGGINGSQRWSFIDWTVQWDKTSGMPTAGLRGPLTMESLLYAYTLGLAAQLFRYVGRAEQAAFYERRKAALKEAINNHCLGEDGFYQDGPGIDEYSQHCQVWAVLADVADERQFVPLLQGALSHAQWPQCSVAMAFYLFRALEKAGLYAETAALWAPWQRMMADNLTTWEEDPVNKRSDCHAWGSLALYEYPASVLGVRPASPGYTTVSIAPLASWLPEGKGTVITPKGPVHVSYTNNDSRLTLNYTVPEGMMVSV